MSVTPSVEWATERFDLYGHERVPSCLESAFQDLIDNPEPDDLPPPGVEYGDIEVARSSNPDLGDGTHAFRITIPASADDLEVEVFLDMVVVRVGRVGVIMTFQSVFEPFPPQGVEELTQVVVDRLNVTL